MALEKREPPGNIRDVDWQGNPLIVSSRELEKRLRTKTPVIITGVVETNQYF